MLWSCRLASAHVFGACGVVFSALWGDEGDGKCMCVSVSVSEGGKGASCSASTCLV